MESLAQLGAVLLVLALLSALVFGLRGRNFSFPGRGVNWKFDASAARPAKRVQVLERVSLTPQNTLCLVRVGGRDWIVTTAPGGCSVTAAPETATPNL